MTDGVKAYWHCADCGYYYSDEALTSAIADIDAWKIGDGKISAKGHTPGADDGDCTTEVICTVCGQVAIPAKDAHTPDENGACDACDKQYGAKIGDKFYDTFADALAAATAGNTIVLLVDVEQTPIVLGNAILDFNGHTVTGLVLGTMSLNGGLLITNDEDTYKMIGKGADYYETEDAVFSMTLNDKGALDITIISGTVTLAQSWWTLENQTLTIGADATFVIPESMTLNVLSNVIVEENATVEVKGTVVLYTADAVITAPAGLNVVTSVANSHVKYANGAYSVEAHSFPDAWTYDESNHWHKCTGCDAIIDIVAHDYTHDAEAHKCICGDIENFTITWIVDGVETTETYDFGEVPSFKGSTDKAATAQYTYTFAGWTPAVVSVTGAATYTATYDSTVNEYTITFVDEDGTVLQTGKVAYGETPVFTGETPTKAATAQYTYTFAGWNTAIATVTGDATYAATYTETVNKYTITFVDEDGETVLWSGEFDYGATPVFGGAPPTKAATAQYTYTFAGWNTEIVSVTGAATYTATYTETVNKYTITWIVDGVEITETYDFGEVPSFKGSINKAPDADKHYVYQGWDGDLAEITEDATYTAVFMAVAHTKKDDSWITEGDHHWKACSGCEYKLEEGDHVWSEDYDHDSKNHWKSCKCGATKGQAAHAYGGVTYEGDGKTSYTASHTCECGRTETAIAEITLNVTKAPTCTEKGTTTYTANFAEDWATVKVTTEELEENPANHASKDTYYEHDADGHILMHSCCNAAIGEKEEHTPDADDGDCTTDITCSVCGKVTTEGADAHTPNADDGDCTTAVNCTVCGTVTTPAKDAHTPAED
ncbi:MAG: hypothetical protein J6S28_03125, partial [Clostridia bacterium]|nr:hypothetical protein [Clostridia bacterium]